MSDNKRTGKVISGDELSAYERWELPLVGGAMPKSPDDDDIPIVNEQIDDYEMHLPNEATEAVVEDYPFPSAEEIEAIREAAYQEGFEQGKAEGLKKGDVLAQQKIRQLEQHCRQMLTILRALKNPLDQVDEQVERELVALSLKVAQHVVYRHIEQDPQEIVTVVHEALSSLPSHRRQVEIFLNPADIEIIQQHMPALAEDSSCKISADAQQRPGGCRVKTEVSQVDVRLDTRIATIFNRITGEPDDDSRTDPHDPSVTTTE